MNKTTAKILIALLLMIAGSQAYSLMFEQHDHTSSAVGHAGAVDQYGCHNGPLGYHCHD